MSILFPAKSVSSADVFQSDDDYAPFFCSSVRFRIIPVSSFPILCRLLLLYKMGRRCSSICPSVNVCVDLNLLFSYSAEYFELHVMISDNNLQNRSVFVYSIPGHVTQKGGQSSELKISFLITVIKVVFLFPQSQLESNYLMITPFQDSTKLSIAVKTFMI